VSGIRAAVDIGTNSCRLLVIDGDGASLVRRLQITRLGAGVDADGRLDDEAIERTAAVLAAYRELWEDHGADGRVRIAATSAVRDAEDRDRFGDRVRATTGVELEIIDGDTEAALSFRGATDALDLDGWTAVLDVGGGSTELVVGDAHRDPDASVSLQLGSVRLTEQALGTDPPTEGEIARARMTCADRVDEAASALRVAGIGPRHVPRLVGVAGTVTTLGMLEARRPAYEDGAVHGITLSVEQVRAWSDRLLRTSSSEIARLGPVQAGREDVIAAGALIVRTVMERMDFDRLVVSEADSLDALAATAG
jgi:exopolyphosphatase / guanosine-5'-triphosphate,3'-diphosphate pyrophosphatase